jgi:hypothetical protein
MELFLEEYFSDAKPEYGPTALSNYSKRNHHHHGGFSLMNIKNSFSNEKARELVLTS